MNFSLLSILALHFAAESSFAWEVDSRCLRRRQLEGFHFDTSEPDKSIIEDAQSNETWSVSHGHSTMAKNLRGSEQNIHRQLGLEDLTVFQLRMHWEVGYCWQEEWIERKWCLKCEGSKCNTDDYLEIDFCSGSSKQRFIYRPVPDSGGGKIMPFTRPDLCWTRTRVNAHQLRKCGTNVYVDRFGRDKQIMIGFNEAPDEDVAFELQPNGMEDKCMDNLHHPKSNEVIRAEYCNVARNHKTSKWRAINRSTASYDSVLGTSDGASPPSPTPTQTQTLPRVKALGKNYCNDKQCGICEGDCDNDRQCAGDLKCFQRNGGDEVPGCGGGQESHSDTDYCYDPNNDLDNSSPSPIQHTSKAALPVVQALGKHYCNDKQCGICEGDCDNDNQCAGDLKCFQRSGGDEVPGCAGGRDSSSDTDYCYDPNSD